MTEYISREAVTTLFARACGECREACEEFDGFYADCNECLLHGVLKEFAALPASDVRPVARGRWEKCVGENGVTSACRCSLCGFEDNRFSMFNFCPNCGADMKQEPPKEERA